MIRVKSPPPAAVQSKSRVLAWLAREAATSARRIEIAKSADVDEKTLRLAMQGEWDPRVSTLEKLEAVIPHDWQPEAKRARAAA